MTLVEPELDGSLRGHVAHGVRWGLFNQVVQQGARLLAQLVLTRLLAPDDFGLMGICLILVNLGSFVAGLGMPQALVQRPKITAEQVGAALGASLLLGIALASAVLVLARPVAGFFDHDDVAPMLRVLCIVFLCQSVEGVPNAMLRRAMRFREFVLSSTIAALAGAAVAVSMAAAGADVWSLVGFATTEAFIAAALAWVFAIRAGVWRPHLSFDVGQLRDLAGYSGSVTATRVVVYGLQNVDNMIIGRALGAIALGYYGLAYRVLLFPIQRVTEVVAGATLPAFARMADDDARVGSAFLRAVRVLALVLVPATLGIALTAGDLVPLVFGSQWEPAVEPVRILCLSGPAVALLRLNGGLWEATGKATWTLVYSTAYLLVLVPAFVIGSRSGINGVAWAATICVYASVLPGLWIIGRTTGIGIRGQLVNVFPVAVGAVALAVAVGAVGGVLDDAGHLPRLVACACAGATAYAAGLLLVDRSIVRHALADLRARTG
jgi:PST family polysaccharide transporter